MGGKGPSRNEGVHQGNIKLGLAHRWINAQSYHGRAVCWKRPSPAPVHYIVSYQPLCMDEASFLLIRE